MNDILQMIQMIKNPQEYVKKMMANNTNPVMKNLIQMAEKNDKQGLESFARNMLKEQGQNYDEIIKILNMK